ATKLTGITISGGTIHVLGPEVIMTDDAIIDVSANSGSGIILFGGDYEGATEVERQL
ncbi:MAG: hypothetical protein HQ542_10005, partial [Bacteroidia bacterium]|nr:hypothetical protein [Bacteroidia bacterium]